MCTSAAVGGAFSVKAGKGDDVIDTTGTVATGAVSIDAGTGMNTVVS